MKELTSSVPIAPLLLLYWGVVTIGFYVWTRRQRAVRAIKMGTRSGSASTQLELSIPLGAFVLCLALPLVVGLALLAL
jgi:hypothetical protein